MHILTFIVITAVLLAGPSPALALDRAELPPAVIESAPARERADAIFNAMSERYAEAALQPKRSYRQLLILYARPHAFVGGLCMLESLEVWLAPPGATRSIGPALSGYVVSDLKTATRYIAIGPFREDDDGRSDRAGQKRCDELPSVRGSFPSSLDSSGPLHRAILALNALIVEARHADRFRVPVECSYFDAPSKRCGNISDLVRSFDLRTIGAIAECPAEAGAQCALIQAITGLHQQWTLRIVMDVTGHVTNAVIEPYEEVVLTGSRTPD